MFLVLQSRLCSMHWHQVLIREWRCSWRSADRRCSNYICVINNFIAYLCAAYIKGLAVYGLSLGPSNWITPRGGTPSFDSVDYGVRYCFFSDSLLINGFKHTHTWHYPFYFYFHISNAIIKSGNNDPDAIYVYIYIYIYNVAKINDGHFVISSNFF